MEKITTGATPNEVRDPSFAKIDDARASDVLRRVVDCGEQLAIKPITLTSEQCADLVAMLSSRSYLFKIADGLGEPYTSTLRLP